MEDSPNIDALTPKNLKKRLKIPSLKFRFSGKISLLIGMLLADAIKAEGIAEAKGIKEMNDAMASVGGEALVKLEIAEALQDKKILLLPVSEGGMNLKTTYINALLNTMGIQRLSSK